MPYRLITLEIESNVGLIRLNRPDNGNALNLETVEELLDAATRCDEDPNLRAVVLTGNGRMFCAGGDLDAFAGQGEKLSRYIKDITRSLHAAISRFNWMDPPVIGAINGAAAGAGFSLALATDISIAAESAKFTMAYTKAGLTPDGSSSYFLARTVGMRRAKEMALLNPILSARQAMDWGLVNQVAAGDEVLNVALEIARQLARGPTRSFGETKRLILSGVTESLESQMEREARVMASMACAADGREGIAAFLAKRQPEFHGE